MFDILKITNTNYVSEVERSQRILIRGLFTLIGTKLNSGQNRGE